MSNITDMRINQNQNESQNKSQNKSININNYNRTNDIDLNIAIFVLGAMVLGYVMFYYVPVDCICDLTNRTYIMFVILVFGMVVGYYSISGSGVERFTASELSNEALQDIASIYNNKEMVVNNLKVTGRLTVDNDLTSGTINTPKLNADAITTKAVTSNGPVNASTISATSGTIGSWNIRGNRMGIPGSKDISNSPDWLRIVAYGKDDFAGLAANEFWENNDRISAKYVGYNRNIYVKANDFNASLKAGASNKCYDFGNYGSTDCTTSGTTARIFPN